MYKRRHRRGRYYPRFRRFWRRRRRPFWRRRRRPRGRVGWRKVFQHVPRRRKYLWVRGWEPLGNICASDGVKTEATPYFSVEPQGDINNSQWHGTWGKHYFTFNNLLQRAAARWCLFSSDWESYDYVMFAGGTISIPQTSHIPWLINFDEYLQTRLVRYNEKNKEDHWGHPGILLNTPKTHIIFPPWNYRHQKMYKIKIKPSSWVARSQRFPEAMSYICCHWLWTYCDFEHAFYDHACEVNTNSIDTCQQQPWWVGQNFILGKWVDRTLYDDPCVTCQTCVNDKNWGPFLPQRLVPKSLQCSLFFMYKLKFKLYGNAIWRPLPRQYQTQGLVPDPQGPNTEREAVSESQASQPGVQRRRKRPRSEHDIWPEDLDSDGILTERAYRRITADNTRDEQPPLEKRIKLLQQRLRSVLDKHNLLRK
nr:ORF1 [Torque teno felis virus]